METDVQKLLDTLASMRERANVNACFGEPATVEGRTVIPVARISYGFGIGVGQKPTAEVEAGTVEKTGTGGGGGGGITASPLGVIEVTSKGTRVQPVIDQQRIAIASILVAAWSAFWVARALAVIFKRGK